MQAVKLQYARSYSEEMRKMLIKNSFEGREIAMNNAGGGVNGGPMGTNHVRTILQNSQLESVLERSFSITEFDNATDEDPEDQKGISEQKNARNGNTQEQPVNNDQIVLPTGDQEEFDLLILNVHTSMQKVKTTANQETVLMVVSGIWILIILFLAFIPGLSLETQQLIVGLAVNLNLVIFYGAPLSTIHGVITSKLSASIHIPTMMLNTTNGALWGIYGIFVRDPFVAIPNCLGVMLGVIQVILCVVYPRERPRDPKSYQDSTRSRRTIVMLSTRDLNDAESMSVMSIGKRTVNNVRSSRTIGEILSDPTFFQGKIERLWL